MRTPEEERLWGDLKRQSVLASNAGGVLDKALKQRRYRPGVEATVSLAAVHRLAKEDFRELRTPKIIVDEDGKPLAELWPLPVRP